MQIKVRIDKYKTIKDTEQIQMQMKMIAKKIDTWKDIYEYINLSIYLASCLYPGWEDGNSDKKWNLNQAFLLKSCVLFLE